MQEFLLKYVSTTKTVSNQLKTFKNKIDNLEDRLVSISTERMHTHSMKQRSERIEDNPKKPKVYMRSLSTEKNNSKEKLVARKVLTPKRSSSSMEILNKHKSDVSSDKKVVKKERAKDKSRENSKEKIKEKSEVKI